MAGMRLGSGIQGSVFAGGYPGYASAAVPAASTVPEGPSTITQQAYGVPGVGGGGRKGSLAAALGVFAVGALVFLWWSLPRLGGGHEVSPGFVHRRGCRLLGVAALHRHGQHRQGRARLMRVEIRDPYGTVIAEGPLTVHDSPGIDEHTPSTLDEIRTRLRGRRLVIQVPEIPPEMAYTLLVIE